MSAVEIAFVVAAYLLGSVSFAVIVSRVFQLDDPRTYGSKNPGATNVLRSGKKLAAVLTLIGDALKGWVAVLLARLVGDPSITHVGVAAVAVAVVVGHMWPVFFRFQGGKGVATAAGVLFALNPLLGLYTLGVWLGTVLGTRISSAGALAAGVAAPLFGWWLVPYPPIRYAVLIVAVLLIARHHQNIVGLIKGTEWRVGTKDPELEKDTDTAKE